MMQYMDRNPMAAAAFVQEIKKFVEENDTWSSAIVEHDISPFEAKDITLISQHVYGNRDEILAVQACIPISRMQITAPQTRIKLPSKEALEMIKRKVGFESIADKREDGAPVWLIN